jgi:tetratricopeptide (TPR) repeat protein
MKESEFDKIDEWFEGWEEDYELLQEEKYEELLKLRKSKAIKNPNDLYAQYYYGQALVYNKMYNEAIDYLTPFYFENPDYEDIQFVILDSLYLSGRNEMDFKWIEMPKIKKIDNELLNECYKCLRKNGTTNIDVLMGHLAGKYFIYLGFSEADLVESLKNDLRFYISSENEISLTKKNNATHR